MSFGEHPGCIWHMQKSEERKRDRVVIEVTTTVSSHLPVDSLPIGSLHIACSTSAKNNNNIQKKKKKKKKKRKKKKNYSTEYSHVVPHHSTDSAINCLTAQIGRDAVGLVVYGRSSKGINFFGVLSCLPPSHSFSHSFSRPADHC